jgi:hypothetical protein
VHPAEAVPLRTLQLFVALSMLPLAACGSRGVPGADSRGPAPQGDARADAATRRDGRADRPRSDGLLPAFCSGSFAHLIANGIDSTSASVTGTALPLNCCEAAELVVITQTVPAEMVPIVVWWRAQVGSSTSLPATIDLASPPPGWMIQVEVGCDFAHGGCAPAPDSYTTGLEGTLQIARSSGGGGYTMSICLSVTEPAGSPHPILHSLQLYAPNVTAGY